MKTTTHQSTIIEFVISVIFYCAPITLFAQTTINLAERCDCEITKHTSEVTAGDTSPAGENQGDMLIDPSGDLYYWDGDSWEYANDGDWTVNGTAMYNNNSGNVGVGTTSPEHGFHVDKAINNDYSMKIQNNGGNGYGLWVRANAGTEHPILNLTDNNDASKFMVLGNGNVGVGTTDPDNRLHVFSSSTLAAKFETTTSSQSLIEFEDGAGVGAWVGTSNNNGAVNGITSGDFAIRTFNNRGIHLAANGGTSDLTIVGSTGNVGIGTTTPNQKLSVNGNVIIGHTNAVGSATNTDDGFTLAASGYLWGARANSNGVYYAQLLGTSGNLHAFYVNSAQVGSISSNGATTSFNTTSDYRLKQNITPLQGALKEINKLKPSSYQFKATPETTEAGFIAHELQEIYPQAVTGVKDEVDEEGKPKYQNVDYGKLTPLLTAGIQELKEIVNRQQVLLNQQQAMIDGLQSQLNEVKSDNALLDLKVNKLNSVLKEQDYSNEMEAKAIGN